MTNKGTGQVPEHVLAPRPRLSDNSQADARNISSSRHVRRHRPGHRRQRRRRHQNLELPLRTTRRQLRRHHARKRRPRNLIRYTGELLDLATNTYHLRARQYDPDTGRFTTNDPVSAPLTDPYISSYVYVRNQTAVLVDPSGRHHTSWWDGECSWSRDAVSGIFDFHEACTEHDRCLELGGSFDGCDAEFLYDMAAHCVLRHASGSYLEATCLVIAYEYYTVASNFPFRS
jgi:RHS repeat-associated protein